MSWWSTWRAKYEHVVEEYGTAAIVTYIVLRLCALVGFYVAITQGFDVGSTAGSAGTVGAAWAASKVTQPLWMGLAVVLTPFAVRFWRRLRPPPPTPAPPPSPTPPPDPTAP